MTTGHFELSSLNTDSPKMTEMDYEWTNVMELKDALEVLSCINGL